MVIETLNFLQNSSSIAVISIPVIYPVNSESEIIDSFVQELQKHVNVRMCIFDHVSSMVSANSERKYLVTTLHNN